MFYVYALQNPKGKIYIGHTNNLERRTKEHNLPNSSYCRYTKNQGPWKLVYREEHHTRGEAMTREKFFKTGKGREELHRTISRG